MASLLRVNASNASRLFPRHDDSPQFACEESVAEHEDCSYRQISLKEPTIVEDVIEASCCTPQSFDMDHDTRIRDGARASNSETCDEREVTWIPRYLALLTMGKGETE